jgi:hypothetical protein
MKKLSAVASITFFLSFLGLFFYFYKNSRKFRKSIASSLLAALVLFSWSLESQSKSADPFTPQDQSRPYKRPGFFSGSSKNNDPGGNGEGGDDKGIPKYSQPESVEQTTDRIQRMHEQNVRLEEVTDSQSESECESTQNKAGIDELPDSENFSYNMDQGRGLKEQDKRVWKNPKAKKEVLIMLERFGNENAEIQEKSLKGFKKLTELKNSPSGPRIFIYREKNEKPVVVGFCMRNDLDATLSKLKKKFT